MRMHPLDQQSCPVRREDRTSSCLAVKTCRCSNMALLSGSLVVDVGVALLGLLGLAYLFATRHFGHWKKRCIPFLEPTPFVGNFKEIILAKTSIGRHLMDIYLQTKRKPYIGIFAFDHPILLVRDLDLIRHILVKDFNYFSDRTFQPSEKNDPMFGKMLFSMTGARWKHLRVKLTPTFTSGKMKVMFDLVNECGRDLAGYLTDVAKTEGIVEIKEAVARYSTDVIATCAFGIKGNSLKNPEDEFRKILKKVFDFSVFKNIKFAAAFFAPKVVSTFNWKIVQEEVNVFLRSVVWSTVDYREKNGVVRKDFLDLIMQIRSKGQVDDDEVSNGDAKAVQNSAKYVLDGDDFVAQAFIFLAAGFETSSTTMGFALYELALQPEVQGRLRAEIRSVLDKSGGQVMYDGIQEMEYLDMVVHEALRKYPVVPFLDRKVVQDYTIPGSDILLEKETSIMMPVLGIQMDPEFYPEPDRFDPERFTEENKSKRPNYTYLPFGEGPRNCIGARMGYMQVKVGLVYILSQFEVCPCKHTPVPLKLDPKSFLMSALGGIPLTFNKIN